MIRSEHKAAAAATFAALLAAILAVQVGADLGNTLAATLFAYTATVITLTVRYGLQVSQILRSTRKGTIGAAVVAVLLLVSMLRTTAALTGVAS